MNKKAAFLSSIFTLLVLVLVTGMVALNLQTRSLAVASGNGGGQVAVVATQAPADSGTPKITPDQASQIALQDAGPGESLGSTPEEVLFNGTVAYEVKMQDGSLLYINANDGSLGYNSITGTTAPVASPDQAVQTASAYINNNQPVAIEWARYQNQQVYAVGFADGSVVLVSRAGNVVAAQVPQEQ